MTFGNILKYNAFVLQIKTAMSSISLGLQNIAPPEWARNIPENKWIEDLLQEVRRHKSSANNIPSSNSTLDPTKE